MAINIFSVCRIKYIVEVMFYCLTRWCPDIVLLHFDGEFDTYLHDIGLDNNIVTR